MIGDRPHELAARSTAEIARLFAAGDVVALLPVGSTEAHGPHLPLSTDVIIAEAAADRAARLLDDAGVKVVVLPTLPYAVCEFVGTFSGTISVRADTVALLIGEVAASVFRQGVATLALVNGHLEPEHGRMLRETARAITERGPGTCIFPDQRRPPTVTLFGEEFSNGGGHAGGFETSIVLAAKQELVDEDQRRALVKNPVDIAARMRDGARDAIEAGGPDAWFGDPAGATATEGERLLTIHADLVFRSVMDVRSRAS